MVKSTCSNNSSSSYTNEKNESAKEIIKNDIVRY